MAPVKRLKGTITPGEFKLLREAIDKTGIKHRAAAKRKMLPHLTLKEFKEKVLGAVFRKIVPRVPFEDGIQGLLYTWYKAAGEDNQIKFNASLVAKYIKEDSPNSAKSQSSSGPPKKRMKKNSSNGLEDKSSLIGKRYVWCWTHIIREHLSITDVLSLAQTNRALERITYNHLERTTFLIDKSFLNDYPIDENKKLYSTLRKLTKNLSLKDLPGESVKHVIANFPNVVELTMSNIFISSRVNVVPRKIRKLELLNCNFDKGFSVKHFPKMCKNLNWASLSNCQDIFDNNFRLMEGEAFLDSLTKSAKNLQYLYVDNVKKLELHKFCLESLKHLKIKSIDEFQPNLNRPPYMNLTWLEIEYSYSKYYKPFSIGCFPALTFLTLRFPFNDDPAINNLRLEIALHVVPDDCLQLLVDRLTLATCSYREIHLQIIRCSSEEEREKLNPSGNHMSETVCYDANPKPIEDAFIFERLNDDCLLKIVSYLTLGAFLNLASTHSRFCRLFRDNVYTQGKHLITRAFADQYPILCPNDQLQPAYTVVCRNLISLKLKGLDSDEVLLILNACKRLKHLSCEEVNFTDSYYNLSLLPENLESLELLVVRYRDVTWRRWFKRLNKSLKALSICESTVDNFGRGYGSEEEEEEEDEVELNKYSWLCKLKNLCEFRYQGDELPSGFKQFLLNNQNTLEHLTLKAFAYDVEMMDYEIDEIISIFPTMTKLKVMHLKNFADLEIHLPKVTEELTVSESLHVEIDARNVKTLTLLPPQEEQVHGWRRHFNLRHFVNLEHLEICYREKEENLSHFLVAMEQLRHLTLYPDCGSNFDADLLLNLVISTPQLQRMSMDEFECNFLKFEYKLGEYLKSAKRAFRFNNVVFDGHGAHKRLKVPNPNIDEWGDFRLCRIM